MIISARQGEDLARKIREWESIVKTVNVHSHVVLPEFMGAAGKYGPWFESTDEGFVLQVGDYKLVTKTRAQVELQKSGQKIDAEDWLAKVNDPYVRLKEMDAKGIDIMGVTTSPLFYLYAIEPELAVPYARTTNDALAKYCSADPNRFFVMATLPMQDPAAAREELIRGVRDLGIRGINLGATDFGSRQLDDEAFYPLWAECERLGVPVCIHPAISALNEPFNVKPDVYKYQISLILEYVFQESVAWAMLVYGGVFDHFPNLKVYITHGGGMIPYQFGRLEALSTINGSKAKRPIREYLDNFVFDIHIQDPKARRFLVDFMGADRLLVGDNYAGLDSTEGLELLREMNLPKDQEEKIAGLNAIRLFKLDSGAQSVAA